MDNKSPLYVDLRDHFDRLLEEHDRRYEQRFVALERRVLDWKEAADKALTLAKNENDQAAQRLREALDTYRASVNEWQGTFRDFKDSTLPRGETLVRLHAIDGRLDELAAQIQSLRRGESSESGRADAQKIAQDRANRLVGIIVVVAIAVMSTIATLIYFIATK